MPQEQKPTKADALDAFCQMLRSVVRPAVTIIFATVIAQIVTQGTTPPEWFLGLAIPCITWWFAERTITHVREKKEE